MAGGDLKWRSVGASGTRTSGQANSEEEVGLDRTHPPEAGIQQHMPSPKLEPAGKEEERQTSQQLEARHWGRVEAARLQLDKSSKNSPEQSALAKSRRWPMLHREWLAYVSKYCRTCCPTCCHGAKLKAWRQKKCFIFFTSGFWNCKFLFVKI